MKYTLSGKYVEKKAYTVRKSEYMNNRRIALEIMDVGEVAARLTVNMPDVHCPDGHAWIKGYAENEGLMESAVKAGIIGPVVEIIDQGWVSFTLHKVLI